MSLRKDKPKFGSKDQQIQKYLTRHTTKSWFQNEQSRIKKINQEFQSAHKFFEKDEETTNFNLMSTVVLILIRKN